MSLKTGGEGIEAAYPKKSYTIYLVTGITGEYADTARWNVKAFLHMDGAINFLEEINTVIQNQLNGYVAGNLTFEQRTELEKALLDLDPNALVDYTGVDYEIEEITLEE